MLYKNEKLNKSMKDKKNFSKTPLNVGEDSENNGDHVVYLKQWGRPHVNLWTLCSCETVIDW